jgi:RNA polymerase sigma-70 factor (ECF subfamily)
MSSLAFDQFLRAVERRAIRIAELGEELHPRAVEHVARAMAELAGEWTALPEAAWPAAFWGRLQRRLAVSRGAAPMRAHDRFTRHEEEPPPGQPDHLAAPEAAEHLESALRALSAPQRLAFLLRVWEGLELPTVAAALELPLEGAKAELFHALQRLHARLAPGATDRGWVLRCRELLDAWAARIEPPSLAPLAVVRRAIAQASSAPPPRGENAPRRLGLAALLAGAALLTWHAYEVWRERPAPSAAPAIVALRPEAPPTPWVEPAPVAAPDYELLADGEQFELLRDLDFYAWHAREHAADE